MRAIPLKLDYCSYYFPRVECLFLPTFLLEVLKQVHILAFLPKIFIVALVQNGGFGEELEDVAVCGTAGAQTTEHCFSSDIAVLRSLSPVCWGYDGVTLFPPAPIPPQLVKHHN